MTSINNHKNKYYNSKISKNKISILLGESNAMASIFNPFVVSYLIQGKILIFRY